MTYPGTQDDFSAVCPYLGLADDPDSHATYATDAHRCYKLDNPTRIASNHQEAYCLGANHPQCPVYRGEGIAAAAGAAAAGGAVAGAATTTAATRSPFDRDRTTTSSSPRAADAGALSPRPRSGGISLPVATIGLFVLAVVVIALAFWIQSIVGDDDDDGGETPADTLTQEAQTATANAGDGETATPGGETPTTPAEGGGETATAAPTEGGEGGEQTYVIQEGDFCGAIADQFGITLEEFLTANNFTEDDCSNLAVGQEVIIPASP